MPTHDNPAYENRMGSSDTIAEFWVCECCVNHSDMKLVPNRKVVCPECGLLCSCPGCISDSEAANAR